MYNVLQCTATWKGCGDWRRVRHVPEGEVWHPARDVLRWVTRHHVLTILNITRGHTEYGDPQDDSRPWSVTWSREEYDELMFASGDFQYWMIVSRLELFRNDGMSIDDESIELKASSFGSRPHHGETHHAGMDVYIRTL